MGRNLVGHLIMSQEERWLTVWYMTIALVVILHTCDRAFGSQTDFEYNKRPLVRWAHRIAGYPYNHIWFYIPNSYAIR